MTIQIETTSPDGPFTLTSPSNPETFPETKVTSVAKVHQIVADWISRIAVGGAAEAGTGRKP